MHRFGVLGLCKVCSDLFDLACRYVRNTTARAFSVVASALGIPALLPFLKAVCQSKKSWQARHTGIKIVQQVRLGVSVLLSSRVNVCRHDRRTAELLVQLTMAVAGEMPWDGRGLQLAENMLLCRLLCRTGLQRSE